MLKPSIIENAYQRPDGSPASLTEVLKRIVLRISKQSHRRRGVILTATEVRALDWAVVRDSSIANADERWLLSAARNRDITLDEAA